MSDATQRGSMSREQLRDWRDFIETAQLASSIVGAQLQADSGISSADYSVMLGLSEAPEHTLRASQLAADLAWDRSRLSHQLGRMEKRGLIRREKCVEDSRGAFVILNDAGFKLFRRASVPHLRSVQENFISALTPEQLVALGAASAALRAHLTQSHDKTSQ